MPELPDLQVFSANLTKALKGKKVKHLSIPVSKKLNVTPAGLKKAVEGHTVKEVARSGKELYISFTDKVVLGMHLMLHGELHILEGENTHKHVMLELQFEDNTGFALTDWQGIAKMTLNPEENEVPDALSEENNLDYLTDLLQTKSIVKNVLMDQKKIRGIGNAYADEILWDARISPFSISNKIPDANVKKLSGSIKKVLVHAEKEIRKANPDIISGEIRDFLLIHNAKIKESPTGAAIEIKTAGGRKTYYTKEQELFK